MIGHKCTQKVSNTAFYRTTSILTSLKTLFNAIIIKYQVKYVILNFRSGSEETALDIYDRLLEYCKVNIILFRNSENLVRLIFTRLTHREDKMDCLGIQYSECNVEFISIQHNILYKYTFREVR
jgi:hypothetical protein